MQNTLLQDENNDFKTQKEVNQDNELEKLKVECPLSYCKTQIISELYLWDMRCWNKYKDREEVLTFLKEWKYNQGWSLNCGHTALCIHLARDIFKEDIEKIADWFMENTNIQFKNRLVKCWHNPELCPKYKEHNCYGDFCDGCK